VLTTLSPGGVCVLTTVNPSLSRSRCAWGKFMPTTSGTGTRGGVLEAGAPSDGLAVGVLAGAGTGEPAGESGREPAGGADAEPAAELERATPGAAIEAGSGGDVAEEPDRGADPDVAGAAAAA
jgi:hypothetical protein